jgi:hypothetical protein
MDKIINYQASIDIKHYAPDASRGCQDGSMDNMEDTICP